MPDVDGPIDLGPYLDLKRRVIRRLRSEKLNEHLLAMIRSACEKALEAEGVVLSRVEKKRLVLEVCKSLLTDLQ